MAEDFGKPVRVAKKVRLEFDRRAAVEIPLKYVNHVEVRETAEEVFITMFTRLDHLANMESDEPSVELISNGTFVITKAHAQRLGRVLINRSFDPEALVKPELAGEELAVDGGTP